MDGTNISGEGRGDDTGGIAIVGLSGRFPGAASAAAFWKNICDGVVSISHFSPDELEDEHSAAIRTDPAHVAARSVLDNVDLFDARFFGIQSRDAALIDPQQRVLLECAWEAFEDAGWDPAAFDGTVGVFAGSSLNTYLLRNVLGDRDAVEQFTSDFQVGSYNALLGALQDFVATRIAYRLDLKGPAITVSSACSTSLLAVAEACKSLLFHQCDMALAGGVSITFPQKRGYLAHDGGLASRDGTCRPFDAEANGTVFGSGAGLVVLRRLEDAIADGDNIYAVIRGFAVNNDGAGKVGFTAPSVEGQADVVATAQAMAGFDPQTIGYVECHGTGTPLGDPIEIAALTRAFRDGTDEKGFSTIGTAKANVGHLDAAAGVTGLIKTALMLRNKIIPPLAGFARPNPRLELDQSPFRIATECAPWESGNSPRRAGVSAFGVGGTNVHVVLEEAPPATTASAHDEAVTDGPHVLMLSAQTETALAARQADLADFIESTPQSALPDIAFTLESGRRAFTHRAAFVASNRNEALAALRGRARATGVAAKPPRVVFVFPGQGAQYPGMARHLFETEPVFRAIVERGTKLLEPKIGCSLLDVLYGTAMEAETMTRRLRSTLYAQPALFLVEYGLARLLMDRGVRPDAMVGHSVGEVTAACLAGVMKFEEALSFVAERGRIMQDQPEGSMLAVRMAADALRPLLPAGVDIAAINAPALCVASGPTAKIEELRRSLDAGGIVCRPLHTSHAFHSAMMEAAVPEIESIVRRARLRAPTIPFASGVTGAWITADEAQSPTYWAHHCREMVRFADALKTAAGDAETIFIEVGPGTALTSFVNQSVPAFQRRAAIQALPDFAESDKEPALFAEALARLWTLGVKLHMRSERNSGGAQATMQRISLPTYPFERQRHWIKFPSRDTSAPREPTTDTSVRALALPGPATTTDEQHSMASHATGIETRLNEMLEDISGEDMHAHPSDATFLELGFDSLALAQLATQIQKSFGVKLTFREILRSFPSRALLAAHLAEVVPQLAPAHAMPPASAPTQSGAAVPAINPAMAPAVRQDPAADAPFTGIEGLLRDQLRTMQDVINQQLAVLQSLGSEAAVATPATAPASAAPPAIARQVASTLPPMARPAQDSAEADASRFKVYGVSTAAHGDGLPSRIKAYVDDLTTRYASRTASSKQQTQAHRSALADPRSASGFRQDWKEIVYPLVASKAKGSKIWDADGNTYVDLVNGFGQTMFGHSPDFVVDAVSHQLAEGFAIGPQTPLAGEVAELVREMTGVERVTFCNTGSEAVMAAMRIARAVTGRETIVVFAGAYHGQFDEVLVKGGRKGAPPAALPIAPGIPRSSVSNVVVLPYAAPESLAWIREHADDIAAVVTETVQSRHPDLQPREFLAQLRAITQHTGAALVFDEVVTGFRTHPGGMQAVYGIRADLVTYGKVIGGGLPIGVLAGNARFMDALDGGMWRFGDESVPEVAPTFFAGTFVRHPLALAAAKAVLQHLQQAGPQLQRQLNERTGQLVSRLNAALESRGINSRIETYSSWFYFNPSSEDPHASLFYYQMRLLGVHIQEGFPCFLTTAHTDADIALIESAMVQSLDALQSAGILAGNGQRSIALTPAIPEAQQTPAPEPRAVSITPTEPQSEIYVAAQLGDEASCAFNESVSIELGGDLDHKALTNALNDVIARHDALRGRFPDDGETMEIAASLMFDLPVVDLSRERNGVARLDAMIASDARMPFDLANGPLVRAQLVRLAADRHVLILTAHHIVCDGWSINVVTDELGQFYRWRAGRSGKPDLAPAMAFADYARVHTGSPEERARNEAFWLERYATLPPPLDLPLDRPRGTARSHKGATLTAAFDAALLKDIKAFSARSGSTLFTTLFCAVHALMARLSSQHDIVITVPAAGQNLIEDSVVVGHCVDFLAVRQSVDLATPFAEHIKGAQAQLLSCFDHQRYTFGTLVENLKVPRDPARTPLADVQFNLERLGEGVSFDDLTARITPNPKAFVNFNLFFNMIEGSDGLRIDVDYATELLDASTITRWLGHLETLLRHVVRSPATPVGKLDLLRDSDRDWLLNGLNQTAAVIPDGTLVHHLFEEQARTQPDAVAAVCGGERITYAALDVRANRMARYVQSHVRGSGNRIAIVMERSIDMLAAMLAVLKAGNAYVPLDRHHPVQRLRDTLASAEIAGVIMSDDALAEIVPSPAAIMNLGADGSLFAEHSALSPATPLPREPSRVPAYVIFTSGSSGRPKGVVVPHRAVVNFLLSMAKRPGFRADDTIVAATTCSFDISGLELLLPLVTGGRTIIATEEEASDPAALVRLIESSHATVMQATPTMWRVLLDAGLRTGPQLTMLCGGEALTRDLANALIANGGPLWNMYGPTETTIWSSAWKVVSGRDITIGDPIDNTQLYVLDAEGRLVPPGVPGELCIGGAGLAIGYFNRPDLTATAFQTIDTGTGKAERIYRTGDLAKRLGNGSIRLLGRKDQQVKLRGYRIELEEIEIALRKLPEISNAAVVIDQAGTEDAALTAIYEAQGGEPPRIAVLRESLGAVLPAYMVPTQWRQVETLPQTGNAKLDRKRLLDENSGQQSETATTEPAGPREINPRLTEIWQQLLKRKDIDPDEDFFDLGGHSLVAMRLLTRVNKAFDTKLQLAAFFQRPTLREMNAQLPLVAANPSAPATVPSQRRTSGQKTTIVALNSGAAYSTIARQLKNGREIVNLFLKDRLQLVGQPIEEIAEQTAKLILQTCPQGPYVIMGYCALGTLSFETARYLKRAGHDVSHVVMLDSAAPTFAREMTVIGKGYHKAYAARDAIKYFGVLLGMYRRGEISSGVFIEHYGIARKLGLARRLADRGWIEPIPEATQSVLGFDIIDTLDKQFERLTLAPYDGDVIVIRSNETIKSPRVDQSLGWRRYVTGRLTIVDVDATHANLISAGAPKIAETLNKMLDEAGEPAAATIQAEPAIHLLPQPDDTRTEAPWLTAEPGERREQASGAGR